MNTVDEKTLVLDLLDNSELAFCQLYALYKDRLITFAMKFVKSREIAEDVFQDAFISVWQNRRFLNPNMPFGPYIYTIVKNRILNLLTNLDRERELMKILSSQAVETGNDIENQLADMEITQLLNKAITKLTPQQKRIFSMSRHEMKSHKEIAKSLNISVYTVQQHISASLKIIRSYLQKHGDGCITECALLFLCLTNPSFLTFF